MNCNVCADVGVCVCVVYVSLVRVCFAVWHSVQHASIGALKTFCVLAKCPQVLNRIFTSYHSILSSNSLTVDREQLVPLLTRIACQSCSTAAIIRENEGECISTSFFQPVASMPMYIARYIHMYIHLEIYKHECVNKCALRCVRHAAIKVWRKRWPHVTHFG